MRKEMIEMSNIFERIIKGKHQILGENIKKYGLYPYNIKNFGKGYKKLFFITKNGTVELGINSDSLDIFEFLRNSHMFVYSITTHQYINVSWIKSTRKYFSKRPYRLMIYLKDDTKIKLSDNQPYSLKLLNNKIRNLIKI